MSDIKPRQEVHMWTDGGSKPNPGRGGWAFIVRVGDNQWERAGGDDKTTNIRMEVTAAIEALKSLYASQYLFDVHFAETIHLHTDSEYVLGIVNRTYKKFKVNTDLVMELQRLILDFPVKGAYTSDSDILIARCHELVQAVHKEMA